MRKFRFSLLLIVLLLATSPFHLQWERLIAGAHGFRLSNYILLGLMVAFFFVALLRALIGRKPTETSAVLLAAAVIFYFVLARRVFLHSAHFSLFLHIAEFLVLGVVIFRENRNAFSPAPILLLLLAAVGLEVVQRWLPGRTFDLQDVWLNTIAGLAGFAVAFF